MTLDRKPVAEMINVHRVFGDKDVIVFLKLSEKDFVEGLFYNAKRTGRAEFFYRDLRHEIIRNKDTSFTVRLDPEQDFTIEQFA